MSSIELTGNMHMHTPYSDGESYHAEIAQDAIKAGLDFIIVTDHNIWVDEVEGYYEGENGRVLLLTGEEVHNVRRQPEASHFLAYGAERELARFADDPQRLIDETREAGGYGFLAHPHEPGLAKLGIADLGWHDWEIEGFTGLEIWNYMSSFLSKITEQVNKIPFAPKWLARLIALRVALNPEKFMDGAPQPTLDLWDRLLSEGKQVVAVGNSDAHATPMSLGPIKRIIYPYAYLFTAVNTHILLPEALTGDAARDKKHVLRAIGQGNSWVGYDIPAKTNGFRFTAQSKRDGIMGDRVRLRNSATLQVSAPKRCDIRLIRQGETVAAATNATHLTHTATQPGAYRVECHIQFLKKKRGWIYSNPIYLT